MNILITNDDGITSPALEILVHMLSQEHSVFVVAPDRDKSGFSHAITVGKEIHISAVSENIWSVEGTPADCVRVAVNGELVPQPDLIVSGINLGANLGTDIIYSGTAGAARQGAMMGIPAIATSVFNYQSKDDAIFCAQFVAQFAEPLAELVSSFSRAYINVNTPPEGDGRVLVTRPGMMRYSSCAKESILPDGRRSISMRPSLLALDDQDSEDRIAVESGAVSLSAMGIWGVHEDFEAELIQFTKLIQRTAGITPLSTRGL